MNLLKTWLLSITSLLTMTCIGQTDSAATNTKKNLDSIGIDPVVAERAISVAKGYTQVFIDHPHVDSLLSYCSLPFIGSRMRFSNEDSLRDYHKWLIKDWKKTSSKHVIKSARVLNAWREKIPGGTAIDYYYVRMDLKVRGLVRKETAFFIVKMTEQPKIAMATDFHSDLRRVDYSNMLFNRAPPGLFPM